MTQLITVDGLRDVGADETQRLGIAGAQIAFLHEGRITAASIGTANRELGLPVLNDTVFQIGSVTKVWTAVLVMQLVEEGRVGLDTPVSRLMPDVVLGPDGDAWRDITPRHLMSMSSGLDNGPYTSTGRGDDAVERYVALLADVPLVFPPGTAYGYSNASTRVSGLLVEHITGLAWDDALLTRVIEPLGLRETVSLFDMLPYYRVAVGHDVGADEVRHPWHLGRGMAPSGLTLACSAGDLVRFAQFFLAGGIAADGTRVLASTAVDAMQTSQVEVPTTDFANAWGLGPYVRMWDGMRVLGHVGTARNGGSTLLWVPEHQIALAVTCNTPDMGARFADSVAEAVFGGLGLPTPTVSKPVADRFEGDPHRYVARYESYGRQYDVTADAGRLHLELRVDDGWGEPSVMRSELLPLGGDRFAARDIGVTWGHGWDLAFDGIEDDGRARLIHNGAFAARRVD